jgi:hypothetical protein
MHALWITPGRYYSCTYMHALWITPGRYYPCTYMHVHAHTLDHPWTILFMHVHARTLDHPCKILFMHVHARTCTHSGSPLVCRLLNERLASISALLLCQMTLHLHPNLCRPIVLFKSTVPGNLKIKTVAKRPSAGPSVTWHMTFNLYPITSTLTNSTTREEWDQRLRTVVPFLQVP